jgi:hypothetical protein
MIDLPVCDFETLLTDISFNLPKFSYAKTRRKTPLEIDFIYSGNKDIYCNF